MAPRKQPPQDAFSTALAMLSRRAYAVGELRQALRRKAFAAGAIEQTVARLKKLGYLDDRKFAEQYASYLVRNRAFGRFRVERELKVRRLADQHIQPALDQVFEESNERTLLDRVLDRKVRTLRRPFTRARFYALCQSLRRHGFRSDDIMKAVRSRPELAPVADETDLDTSE